MGKEGSVLKDQDWLHKEMKLELGNVKEEFLKQLKKDVKVCILCINKRFMFFSSY